MFSRPPTPPDEYTVVMLKPDAFARGLAEPILERVRAAGFAVVASREEQLSAGDVESFFLHPTPAIVQHLTSRPVRFFLVHGAHAPERLYQLKGEIRRELGTVDRVHNLVHAADEGSEYQLLLGRFFPECDNPSHCNAADLDLRLPSLEAGEAALRELERGSNLQKIVVTLDGARRELLPLARVRRSRIEVEPAVALALAGVPRGAELLVHLDGSAGLEVVDELLALRDLDALGAWLARHPSPVTAGLPAQPEEIAQYAADLRRDPDAIDQSLARAPLLAEALALRQAGVTRLACFSPRHSLMQTELMGDLARLAQLYRSGGSGGQVAPGRFSVSYHCIAGSDLEHA